MAARDPPELIEGAPVIQSQCISDTLDKQDRWVGCGTGRRDILRRYFAPPSSSATTQ